MRINLLPILIATAGATCLINPPVASAQATGDAVGSKPATATPAVGKGGPTASTSGTTSLQEVVVTAQRRSQLSRNVPIALTAMTGGNLAKMQIRSLQDLDAIAPGVNIVEFGAFAQPAIRGISTQAAGPGTEPNISTYIDDVYLPQSWMVVTEIPDLDRVEILKGPQGTLFGRNATGGAIRLFTQDPQFTDQGFVGGSVGDYDSGGVNSSADGFVTGSLVPNVLAASFSAFYRRDDGYLTNLTNGQDLGLTSQQYRAKLLYKPTDDLSFLLTSYYSDRNDEEGLGYVNASPAAYATIGGPPKRYDIAMGVQPFSEVTMSVTSLRGTWDLGLGTVRSLTAYTHADARFIVDADGGPVPALMFNVFERPNHNLQQELIFSSNPIGPVDFTAGAFYFDSTDGFNPEQFGATPETPFFGVNVINHTESIAGFGEADWNITQKLTATLGLRYTKERKAINGLIGLSTPPPLLPRVAAATFSDTTPRLALRYALLSRTNVWASFSTGFQSGGFDTNSLSPTPVQPEKIQAYEVGIKSHELANFEVNGSLFFQNITDVQVTTNAGGSSISLLQNAGAERMYGVDLDSTWRVSDALSFRTAFTYMPTAKWTEFRNAAVTLPGGPDGTGLNETIDATGFRVPQAPEMQGSVTATYTADLGAGVLQPSLTAAYNSGFRYDVPGALTEPAYVLFNGELAYTWNSGLTLAAYARNVSNRYFISGVVTSAAGFIYNPAPPREVGIRARYDF